MIFKAMETEEEWAWMNTKASPILDETSSGIMAYDGNCKIVAGFVASAFSNDGCEVHLAIDNPAVIKRGFIQECLHYVFNARGRARVFGLIPACNSKALRFNRRIGFKEVARVPDGFATGIDYIVMRMEAKGNPWVAIRHAEIAAEAA